jgi:hypothetical protein
VVHGEGADESKTRKRQDMWRKAVGARSTCNAPRFSSTSSSRSPLFDHKRLAMAEANPYLQEWTKKYGKGPTTSTASSGQDPLYGFVPRNVVADQVHRALVRLGMLIYVSMHSSNLHF